MLFLSAIVLGILSSFHCIGMCGPIALACPVKTKSATTELVSRILYNSGRSISYLLIGLIAGLAGQGLLLTGGQRWLSILAGITMLTWIIIPSTNPENWKIIRKSRMIQAVKTRIPKYFRKKNYSSIFMVGMLNGLLPCAMVYMAVVAAVATCNLWFGGIYMVLFGFGTWPMMFALTATWKLISMSHQKMIRQYIPVLLSLVAIMLILRGLDLGIPFLSPDLNIEHPTEMSSCSAK